MDRIILGTGSVVIENYSQGDSHGLIFKDTRTPHPIGELTGSEPDDDHEPQPGEFYLRCDNRESALVLKAQVDRMVDSFGEGDTEI